MDATRFGRTEVVEHVDLGTAELVPDPKRPDGWVLMVNGVAQSYVDLSDPKHLEFSYVRRIATVIDALASPGTPIDVLHLGGGGLTLARYIEAKRPGSHQRVVERDQSLAALVARLLPLPSGIDVTIDINDARTAVESGPDAAYDLIISDVYRAAQMPRNVTSTEFTAYVATALRPGGLYVVNVTDLPALAFTRVQAATLRDVFADVCILGEPTMLRGRRFGNMVLVASRQPDGVPVTQLLGAAQRRPGSGAGGTTAPGRADSPTARGGPDNPTAEGDLDDAAAPGDVRRRGARPAAGRLLHGADLDAFIGGARPTRDNSAGGVRQPMMSPQP